MEGLPGWVISPMSGPPPRQHKHEIRDTASTHSFILTRRIFFYDSQMIFGGPGGPKTSWHLSYRWGKSTKKLIQETYPDRGSNPGPLGDIYLFEEPAILPRVTSGVVPISLSLFQYVFKLSLSLYLFSWLPISMRLFGWQWNILPKSNLSYLH